MDENKNQSSGAPSSDTTSALFVSARKKQLEQQEEERRAKEKEEQRLAAEAEVRRLEREVEERRKRAEEETRRIAEQAQATKAMAAENPQSVLGAQPAAPIWPVKKEPVAAVNQAAPGGTAGQAQDKKKLMIIIGAAVVVVLAVVLIIAFSGGKGGAGGVKVDPNMELYALYDDYGLSFYYPDDWEIAYETTVPLTVSIESDYEHGGFADNVILRDVTEDFIDYLNYYGEAVTAGAVLLDDVVRETIFGATYDEYELNIDRSYDGWVTGGTDLEYGISDGTKFHLYLEYTPYDGRLLLTVIDLPYSGSLSDRLALCRRIAGTAALEQTDIGGGEVDNIGGGLTYVTGAAIDNGDGTYTYSDSARNIKATFPTSMSVAGIGDDAIVVVDDEDGYAVGRNLTWQYYDAYGSDAEFTRDYMLNEMYSDFVTLYGEPYSNSEPYLFTDENAQANRLGTGEMWFYVGELEIYARVIVYHTVQYGENTDVVMAKSFFVEAGDDMELDYLYNSVVNIENVN